MNDNITFFRSAIFHNLDESRCQYYQDGLMIVNNGKIQEVDHYESLRGKINSDVKINHFENSLIIPGFIDSHLHYPQYRVIASHGKTLLNWLNDYTFVEEQKFNNINYAEQIASLFFDELIKNGTTTAMSFCTSHPNSANAFFSEAEKRNLRMIGGKVLMDRNAPQALCDTAENGYQESRKLIEKWHNKKRLSYAITPRFAPTSTKQQLKKTAQLLKEYSENSAHKSVRLQSHLNENIDEIKWVKELFPKRKNYLDVYDHYQLTGPTSVFGHCIHNSEDELKRLADSGSHVALCPTSNLFLGSGLFNLEQLEHYKISSALASDIGGGDSFSMFKVMNEAYKICQLNGYSLQPSKAFYLATLAGAKVLNVDDYLGNFTPQKEADFLVLDLKATKLIQQKVKVSDNINDLLFTIMMLGDDRLVDKVFILGQCRYNKN